MKDKKNDKRVLKAILLVVKRRLNLKSLLLLAILLSSNTFAWFIYMNKISGNVDVKVKAWNVSFQFDNETMTDYVTFQVDEVYPGMSNNVQSLKVYNDGEVDAVITYEVVSVNILGTEYNTETQSVTSEELIDKLANDYPFKITMSTTSETLEAENGAEEFALTVIWPYETYIEGNNQDEADTYWGEEAYAFTQLYPNQPCIKLLIKLSAEQKREE